MKHKSIAVRYWLIILIACAAFYALGYRQAAKDAQTLVREAVKR